jgi:two-component system response regulator FlrC
VKSLSSSTPLALWLDPEAPLSAEHRCALNDAGWIVHTVQTLDALIDSAPHASAVVMHLVHDTERLKAIEQLLKDAGLSVPLVCRIDPQALELVVQASQSGAAGVMAEHDTQTESWKRVLQKIQPAQEAPTAAPTKVRHVVFVDPASQHLLALAQKVAQADVTALLVGPTGAGKEVLARVLHEASHRARGPFVALNCAALPDNLIEDMLFGHEKGAFTGAMREHKGVFEQAQGGTLFLDEIGEMPMHLQSKLLRVLQEKQLTRLGGQTVIPLNVRIVAATNKDLRQAIAQKEFREDLYYRIATFRLRLLPLRERPGDIVALALQCLVQNDHSGRAWQLHPEAQRQLLQYPWPGNVRELENVMRRAMVLCPDHCVTPAHLMFDDWLTAETPLMASLPTVAAAPAPMATPPAVQAAELPPLMPAAPFSAADWTAPAAQAQDMDSETDAAMASPAESTTAQDLQSAARLNEHQVIMATLASTPSKLEAAKRLGISPRTLRYKLAQLREHGLGLQAA